MYTRLIRILLVLIAIAIVASAGYFLAQTEQRINTARNAGDLVREQARALGSSIAEIRAAQAGYVAEGQGEDFWMGRVAKLVAAVEQEIDALEGSLTAPGARVAIEQAAVAMENFQKLDLRAQEFAKSGNHTQAGDLIFSDGLESTNQASSQIATAVIEELQARQAAIGLQRKIQLAILGGSAGGILVIMLMLAFTGTARPVKASAPALPVQTAPVTEPATPSAAAATLPPPAAPPAPPPSLQPVLTHAAALCTALGRVTASEQLPALLERSAKLLDASGMIVWVAQPDGASLRPAMSFGYPQQTVQRLGAIHRDANNAAAAAYRAGELRTVAGALVVPLLTPEGCIGVLSAETKGGSEGDESSQAIAAILAAQLATLVSPTVVAASPKAAAQA